MAAARLTSACSMANPPDALAQLGAIFNAALAGQIATKADVAAAVAPLVTQAQFAAAVAPLVTHTQLQAQLAAAVAPLATQAAATQAQLAAMQAQMAALLAHVQLLNAPAIAAAAAAAVQSIVASRMENTHDRSGGVYAVVVRSDGTPPPHWPVAFERSALVGGPIAVVDTLLNDYGLPHGPPLTALERRNALAVHIGTMRV